MNVVNDTEEMSSAENLIFRMNLYNMRCPVCEDNLVEEFDSWDQFKTFNTRTFTYFCYKCGFLAKKKITKIEYDQYVNDYELLSLNYENSYME